MSLSFHKCRHGLLTLVAAAAILTLLIPGPPSGAAAVASESAAGGSGGAGGPASSNASIGVPLAAVGRVLFGSLPATLFWLAVFVFGASLGITR